MESQPKLAVTRIRFEKILPFFVILISISVTLRSLQEQESYLFNAALVLLLISIVTAILTLTIPHIRVEDKNLMIFRQLLWKPSQIKIARINMILRRSSKKGIGGFIFYMEDGTEFEYIPKFQSQELLDDMANFLEEHVKIPIKNQKYE